MKRAGIVLVVLATLVACGSDAKPKDATAICADAKALVDSGTKVLDAKDKWKPVINAAADSTDSELKQSGTTMQALLKSADEGDKNVTSSSFNKALGTMATKCGVRGQAFDPPTTTSPPPPSS